MLWLRVPSLNRFMANAGLDFCLLNLTRAWADKGPVDAPRTPSAQVGNKRSLDDVAYSLD